MRAKKSMALLLAAAMLSAPLSSVQVQAAEGLDKSSIETGI